MVRVRVDGEPRSAVVMPRARTTVSSGSSRWSATIWIVMLRAVSPGWNVSVSFASR